MDIIGERIMLTRKRQQVRQNTLARVIGMSQKHLSQIENGQKDARQLRVDSVIRIAEALGVSTDYLLGLQEEPAHGPR